MDNISTLSATDKIVRELATAEILERTDKSGLARQLYMALLKDHPAHTDVLHHLALNFMQAGQLLEAETVLLEAMSNAKGQPRLFNSFGVVSKLQGKQNLAEEYYRKAIRISASYSDAHYNLGVLLEETSRSGEALAAYRDATSGKARNAKALTRIGAILHDKGLNDQAYLFIEKAVSIDPGYFDAQYYKGWILSDLKRYDEALAALQSAIALKPNSFDARLAISNTLRDADRHDLALLKYWELLELNPDSEAVHIELNRLAWQAGRHDLYLNSFTYARNCLGDSANRLQLEASFRLRRNDWSAAEVLLRQAENLEPERGDVHGLLGRAMSGQGQFDESYKFFLRAIKLEPNAMLHRQELGLALLKGGYAQDALMVFQQILDVNRFDQIALAGTALAYRELGDSRYSWLVDFSRYVRVYDFPSSDESVNSPTLNAALLIEIDRMHTMHSEPIDQTLRGGTQTAGHLFSDGSPTLTAFQIAMSGAVADYIQWLPADENHPMCQQKSEIFGYSGAWSCRLRSEGFHNNHVHHKGWISSVYYARLPASVEDTDRRSGWLKFGESNLRLGARDRPDFWVKPKIGRLVLFPSFFWHGTIPFTDVEDRLTIAFDVVPRPA